MVKGEGGSTVYYASLDGKIIVKGANNDFYYAVINDGKLQPSTFIAHEAGDRTAEERAFLYAEQCSYTCSTGYTT